MPWFMLCDTQRKAGTALGKITAGCLGSYTFNCLALSIENHRRLQQPLTQKNCHCQRIDMSMTLGPKPSLAWPNQTPKTHLDNENSHRCETFDCCVPASHPVTDSHAQGSCCKVLLV